MSIIKRIIITEDNGGFCSVGHYTKLNIKKNSISFKEETDNHIESMFFADSNYSYKYKIESELFESRFFDLAKYVENVLLEIKNGNINIETVIDDTVNYLILEYEDNSKIKTHFYGSLKNYNFFAEIFDILRSMIPYCERFPDCLMTEQELIENYE